MKKFTRIFSVLAAAALAFASCGEEYDAYVPGEPDVDGCYGVYFPSQEATGAHTYDPTMDPVVEFKVARTNSKGDITVPVVYTESEEGIFQVGQLSFVDGQTESTLKVSFPNSKIGTNYSLSLKIDDEEYASNYLEGVTAIDFSVMRVQWEMLLDPKTKEPATVTFYETWWDEVHDCLVKYYEVDGIRTCIAYTENPNEGVWGMKTDFTFTWNVKKNTVDIPKQFMGWDYDDQGKAKDESACSSPVYVYDWYSYWLERGQIAPGIEAFYTDYASSYPRSYYDAEQGIFVLNCQFYIPAVGGGWTGLEEDTKAYISGFTRVDYTVDVELDYSVDGELPVYLATGVDVESVELVAYEGELNATQVGNKVAAIEAGDDKGVVVSTADFVLDEDDNLYYGAAVLTLEKSGIYTVVAVAKDKDGKVQNSNSAAGPYVAADDQKDNAVEIYVGVEDTPERYAAVGDNSNSFAFYVYGKDITDAHIAVIPSKSFDQKALAAIKADAKGTYAVSEDVLKQINNPGGFYTVANGLKAGTEYVVVVWATNGKLDTCVGDFYETITVYDWKLLGKGTYTDGVAAPLYGVPADEVPTVEVDIYEEASTPGLYKMSGHNLALACEYFGVPASVMANFEGTYWRASDLIINATDPTKVFIEEQDFGLCLSSADGFIDGVTSILNGKHFSEGTLKDGAITFPVKGLLLTLNGDGYYYGNGNGMFNITLPEKASKASVSSKSAKNSSVKDFKATSSKMAMAKPHMTYERDPQPVSVKAKVVNMPRPEKNVQKIRVIGE